MSTTEIARQGPDALASEIQRAHNEAQIEVGQARDKVEQAIDASIRCAALVDAARSEWGGSFDEVWRDKVGLSPLEAKRYISLHSTALRCLDKRQLLLTGIIEQHEQEQQHEQRPADPFAWCKWIPRVRDALTDEEIGRMTDDQRAVAKVTLKPLVERYEKL